MLKNMIRNTGIILLLGITAVVIGCSSGVNAPTIPNSVAADTPTTESEGHFLMGAFTFNLNPDSGDVEIVRDRSAELHIDVTPMLFPPDCSDCIGIHLEGIQPGTNIHNIKVNLRNPSTYTVYDVRGIILWDDYDSRRLVNYEALTELFDDGGVQTKNPFVTFKDLADPMNMFGPGEIKSKVLFIDFPKPHDYSVKFIIECSFPGNSKDPWMISSEDVSNPLDESGVITAIIDCRVADHQDDVQSVTVDLTPLGFPAPVEMVNITGSNWEVEISNDHGAAKGYYNCLIEARDATDKWPLYDYVQVVVDEDISPYIYVDCDYTGPPDGSEEKPFPTIASGMANALPGQIVMVKDGSYLENVDLLDGAHIRGYGDSKPVIMGGGETLLFADQFVNSARVENFVLQGNGTTVEYGIRSYESEGLEFRDIDFISTGSAKSFNQAVRAEETQGFIMVDCRFQDLGATGAAPILISLNSSSDILLESNLIKNFAFSPGSSFPTGTGAVIYLYDCDDVVLKQNLIGVVEGGIGLFSNLDFSGCRINGGTNVALRNNLIYDFQPSGDCNLTLSGITVNGTDNYTFEHLTIDKIGYEGQVKGNAYALRLVYGSVNKMVNNIFTNINAPDQGQGYGVYSDNAATQTYSDVWSIGNGDDYRYDGKAAEGVGGLNVDPQYVSPASGDYHLLLISPCLTAGMGGAQMGAYGGPEPLDLP